LIFVTVGNAKQSFKRLIEGVDALAREGLLGDEKLIVQNGHTQDAHIEKAELQPFMAPERFSQCLRDASVIIAHAGNGTLIHALREGKTPVVMPRRKHFSEHIDDHQVQIVGLLEQEGYVISAMDVSNLAVAIAQAKERGVKKGVRPEPALVGMIRKDMDYFAQHGRLPAFGDRTGYEGDSEDAVR